MSVDAHRQAVRLMSEAEVLELRGDPTAAASLYLQAGDLEFAAFSHVPPTRPTTRGILAISAVNLFRSSGDLAQAVRAAHYYLSLPDLPDFAARQLNEILLQVMRELHAREANVSLEHASFVVSLSGGTASNGVASYDAVIWELLQFQKLLVRVIEWVAKQPFRSAGPPSASLINRCMPMLSAPSFGSIQFQVLFQTPLQLELPELALPITVTPEAVTTQCLNILESVVNMTPELLANDVADPKYRSLFLKVIRNIAPSGKEIGEVRVNRITTSGQRSLTLRPEMRAPISDHIRGLESSRHDETVFHGVLRELSLDRNWITVVEGEDRKRLKVRKSDLEGFDDIIGPLVNKPVKISGYWTGKRTRKYYVRDIELAE